MFKLIIFSLLITFVIGAPITLNGTCSLQECEQECLKKQCVGFECIHGKCSCEGCFESVIKNEDDMCSDKSDKLCNYDCKLSGCKSGKCSQVNEHGVLECDCDRCKADLEYENKQCSISEDITCMDMCQQEGCEMGLCESFKKGNLQCECEFCEERSKILEVKHKKECNLNTCIKNCHQMGCNVGVCSEEQCMCQSCMLEKKINDKYCSPFMERFCGFSCQLSGHVGGICEYPKTRKPCRCYNETLFEELN